MSKTLTPLEVLNSWSPILAELEVAFQKPLHRFISVTLPPLDFEGYLHCRTQYSRTLSREALGAFNEAANLLEKHIAHLLNAEPHYNVSHPVAANQHRYNS